MIEILFIFALCYGVFELGMYLGNMFPTFFAYLFIILFIVLPILSLMIYQFIKVEPEINLEVKDDEFKLPFIEHEDINNVDCCVYYGKENEEFDKIIDWLTLRDFYLFDCGFNDKYNTLVYRRDNKFIRVVTYE